MIATASLALAGCTGASSNPATPSDSAPILFGPLGGTPPAKIIVAGTPPAVGASSQFTALAVETDGSSVAVTSQAVWVSSNTAVATVNSSGRVTGVQTGSVEIAATYLTVKGSVSFSI